MLKHWAILLAAGGLCLAAPAFAAEQSPEDAYAACLIGNTALELHNGAKGGEASDRALATCEYLEAAVDADQFEYVIDFVDSVTSQLEVPGAN